MNALRSLVAKPDWRAGLAVLAYAVLVAILLQLAFGAIADMLEKRAAVAEAADMLDRLQNRRATAADLGMPADLPAGSPFLEGPTVTVAGADLMQRVSSAVARFDGRITSSQVELRAGEFGPGFLGLTANLDIAQPDLQRLLYDLEAGMPFLFVDQFVAQGPGAEGAASADGHMKVLLTVYGQWQGAR